MPGLVGRTWALLALAALLPMLAIAWFAVSHTEALLLAQSRVRTAAAAQRQAAATQAQLGTAPALLREAAQQIEAGRAAGLPAEVQRAFVSIALLRADGGLRLLHGRRTVALPIPASDGTRVHAGEPLLRLLPQPGQPARVVLLRALPGGSVLVAELDPAFLWGDAARHGEEGMRRCVLSAGGDAVSCLGAAPPALALQRSLARAPFGALDWRSDDELLVGSYHALPMTQAEPGDWVFLAAEPRQWVLASALPLWRALALALVAGAALAILLGALHAHLTRRSLRALTETARRVADGDAEAQARLPREPELADLGASMHEIAADLALERSVRGALTDLEHQMLDGGDLDALSRRVVSRLCGVFRARVAALVLRGQASARTARLYLTGSVEVDAVQASTVAFDSWVGEQRLLGSEGIWLRAPLPEDAVHTLLSQQGAQQVLVVPVVHARELAGLLLLGFAQEVAPPARTREHLGQFASRLALALAAVSRERALLYRSRFDALTGLPNRQSFVERLSYERERAQREGTMLAVVLVNLDQFKSVNESLGHVGGDDVIRQAAIRLRQSARGVDTVARVGGDEFALLLPGLPAPSEAGRLAAHLMRSMGTPFLAGEQERVLSASVGVALYPVDAHGAEALMRNADTALHRAKDAGGGRVVFFEARMNQEVNRRVTLERELRRAIERDEFVLYYQPQMDARSGMLSGAEALIRWKHPERGVQSPAAFIDIAEQTGLIESIGELVLRKACAQLQAWRDALTAPPRLSVNVSGRQFRRRDFAALVATILRETGVDASMLELEITETVLMEDADAASVVLNQLATLGIRLAIDDFGTGYSSLAYLKRLRFDALKIDRSFVKDVTTDEDSAAIASAIIALARTLRKQTVAEGVETQEQLEFLRGEQCDLIQGFLISRPVPAEQFVAALGRSISRTRSALRLAASR